MALNKTLTANGSRNHHRFTLSVNEDSTSGNSSLLSFTFTLSPVVSGYDWYGWGGRISYSITIGDNTYSGTIPSYDGRSTVTLNSATNIEIPHNSDGTKTINLGFSVSDGAGQSYTCGNASASDTFTLSALHKAPEITNVAIAETNAQLTALSLADNVIAQYLSTKQFTVTATLYDSATISTCNVYYNNVLIGTANSNVVSVNFANVSELTVVNNQVGLTIQVVDSKNGISSQNYTYSVIKYTKPSIEATSTTIRRKTGSGTNLTDNKANLNFVGTCYLSNDLIGNNNTQQVQYKIWNDTEPTYTNVSSTASGNNITITDYEISNVLYTSVYNYKIKIYDSFGNYEEKVGTIPTGKVVWSEYSDHVNFEKLTVQGSNPFEFTNSEVLCGKWFDDDEYRNVVEVSPSEFNVSSNTINITHGISNINFATDYYCIYQNTSSNVKQWRKMPTVFYGNSTYNSQLVVTETELQFEVGDSVRDQQLKVADKICVVIYYTKGV